MFDVFEENQNTRQKRHHAWIEDGRISLLLGRCSLHRGRDRIKRIQFLKMIDDTAEVKLVNLIQTANDCAACPIPTLSKHSEIIDCVCVFAWFWFVLLAKQVL